MTRLKTRVTRAENRVMTIPVCYNGEDLEDLAHAKGLSVQELIDIHSGSTYRVYMIGFQPGFAYMGKLDDRIVAPRRPTPRTRVPAGSVGIAGNQTGIYPFSSPGGWQLIGITPWKIFNRKNTDPCLFKAGDIIQFTPITPEAFDQQYEH